MSSSKTTDFVTIDGSTGQLVHTRTGLVVQTRPPSVIIPITWDINMQQFRIAQEQKELHVGLQTWLVWVCAFPFQVQFANAGPDGHDPTTTYKSVPSGNAPLHIAEALVKNHVDGTELLYDAFVSVPGDPTAYRVDPSIIIDVAFNAFEVRR